ncbi:MAG: IS1595 family transposase [Phycisphaerales bacterium]|nr:IS1595 family transposase [Phycisphaerales bacterium]
MLTYKQVCKLTENDAREYLERLRWPNGPVCAHCGSAVVAKLNGKATRPGVYKCKARECRKQFTVTVGTIFERSHIPLTTWIQAFHLICASKKGVSALQLQRMLGLKSYKSAWHMAHRVRHAMQNEPLRTMLSGTVEADETWVGPRLRGHGTGLKIENKTAVMALVERGGKMRTKVIGRVTQKNLKGALDEMVAKSSRLLTDGLQAYVKLGPAFEGGHETVDHSVGEYARGDVHVNSAESYFALLKRGIHGAFHHVGRHHLHRYADEFAFRWNHRTVTDGERTDAALKMAPGTRLVYKAD